MDKPQPKQRRALADHLCQLRVDRGQPLQDLADEAALALPISQLLAPMGKDLCRLFAATNKMSGLTRKVIIRRKP